MSIAVELTALGWLIATVLFVWRPVWGVYAVVAALPFERLGTWVLNPHTGHPVVRLSQILGLALVAAYGIRLIAGREKMRFHKLLIPLGLFVASCIVSYLLVGQRSITHGIVALISTVAISFVVAQLYRKISIPTLLTVLFASAGAVSVFGLYQFIAGSMGVSAHLTGLRPAYERAIFGFPRIQSTALEPLYFANYLLIPLLIGIAVLLYKPSLLRWWQKITLFIIAIAFALTMSRGAFLALVPASLILIGLVVWSKRLSLKTLRTLIIGLLAVSCVATGLLFFAAAKSGNKTAPHTFWYQITSGVTQTSSFSERAQMRQQAITVFKDHPWFGVGIEGISAYAHNYPAVRVPLDAVSYNNQLLELLDESGIIGTVLFYALLIGLLGYTALLIRSSQDLQLKALTAGLATALIAQTIQAQSYSGFLLLQYWITIGLLTGAIIHNRVKHHAA